MPGKEKPQQREKKPSKKRKAPEVPTHTSAGEELANPEIFQTVVGYLAKWQQLFAQREAEKNAHALSPLTLKETEPQFSIPQLTYTFDLVQAQDSTVTVQEVNPHGRNRMYVQFDALGATSLTQDALSFTLMTLEPIIHDPITGKPIRYFTLRQRSSHDPSHPDYNRNLSVTLETIPESGKQLDKFTSQYFYHTQQDFPAIVERGGTLPEPPEDKVPQPLSDERLKAVMQTIDNILTQAFIPQPQLPPPA